MGERETSAARPASSTTRLVLEGVPAISGYSSSVRVEEDAKEGKEARD